MLLLLRICGVSIKIKIKNTWLTSFLRDMSQCVSIDGARSDKVLAGLGVIQGTLMRILLFLMCIKDSQDEVSSYVPFCGPTIQTHEIRSRLSSSATRFRLLVMLGWDLGHEIQPIQVPHHVNENYEKVYQILCVM